MILIAFKITLIILLVVLSAIGIIAWLLYSISESDPESNQPSITNKEKFTAVFGFEPGEQCCPMPSNYCVDSNQECDDCPYCNWWNAEYKGVL